MKKSVYFFVIVIIFIACNSVKKISLEEIKQIKIDANIFFFFCHLAASEANFYNYFSKMDSTSVFIGTDAKENWNKIDFSAFSKPYFEKGKAWDFKTLERNVYTNSAGDFVWFDELLNTWMGTCRGSGVLEKKDNYWKIKHYVLSISIPNDDVKAVIAAKKKSDSLFLRKFN